MKQKTHVVVVLDQSGSMWKTKSSTINGYNEQVQQAKEDAEDQDILFSLITFNGNVKEHLWNVPVTEVQEANEQDLQTQGSTALFDALGYTIQKLLDTTDTEDENTAYLICVITDGEENTSKHYNANSIKELIESVQSTGKWTISYMGCDGNYLKEVARRTSVPVANCAVWSNSNKQNTEFAFSELKGKFGNYFRNRSKGVLCSANFHSSESGKVDNYVGSSTNEGSEAINSTSEVINSVFNNQNNTVDLGQWLSERGNCKFQK